MFLFAGRYVALPEGFYPCLTIHKEFSAAIWLSKEEEESYRHGRMCFIKKSGKNSTLVENCFQRLTGLVIKNDVSENMTFFVWIAIGKMYHK